MKTTIGSSNSQAARTFNVKSKLPDIYNKLSLINFALDATYITLSASVSAVNKYIIGNGSYNKSTGILTCAETHGQAGSRPVVVNYIVYCYYID